MNRSLTALFAAAEAFLVVAVGLAIPLVPLSVLWGAQYGFAVDWVVFWRAAADVWLLGHGVDVTIVLDEQSALALGFPAAGAPVTLTIAALGFGLLTLLLAIRAGSRVAESRFRVLGELVAVAVFAALSFGVAWSAAHPSAHPSLWQGTVLPTAVFASGIAIGSIRERGRAADAPATPLGTWLARLPPATGATVLAALRGGTAAAALVTAVAAVVTAALILVNYAKIITLYEGLHSEVLGGVLLTVGQLAFVPNIVAWAVSWLVGPGFAIGTGSMVSPLGTQLGPIPAIPVLGALPTGDSVFGYAWLLVPILAGFLAGVVVRGSVVRESEQRGRSLALAGLGIGLVGGIVLGMLAWLSTGAAGPGRLGHVGPDPWSVGFWAAVELSAGALIGLFASVRNPFARDRARPRR